MCDSVFVRWSADHRNRISVELQDNNDGLEWVREDLAAAGCEFFSTDPVIRSVFGLGELHRGEDAEAYCKTMRKAHLEALRTGDHVFFMVHGEHSGHSFWFTPSGAPRPRFSDSWIAGIVVVNRSSWKRNFPNRPASRLVAARFLDEMADYIEHEINGEVFEFVFSGDDGCFASPGFLTEDDAIRAALEEHPECRFADDDFEETRSYRLKAA